MYLLVFLNLILTISLCASEFEVRLVRGKVVASIKNLEPVEISVGDYLFEGTKLSSSSNSFAKLVFEDGSIVTIGADTEIILKRARLDAPSLIHLIKGELKATVTKRDFENLKSSFFVTTKTAALGVRGTEFYVSMSENETGLYVKEGSVVSRSINQSELWRFPFDHRLELDQILSEPPAQLISAGISWSSKKRKMESGGIIRRSIENSRAVIKRGEDEGLRILREQQKMTEEFLADLKAISQED